MKTFEEIFCDPNAPLSNEGKYILPEEAKTYLLNYFRVTGKDPGDGNVVSGHLFGLENLKKLMKDIDDYNSSTDGQNKPVEGVRIYHAVSTRDYGIVVPDVFLVPVLKGDIDVPQVYPGDPVAGKVFNQMNSILGQARPCPNQCNSFL